MLSYALRKSHFLKIKKMMPLFGYAIMRSSFFKKLDRIFHTYHLHIQQVLAEHSPRSRAGRKGGEASGGRNGAGVPVRSVVRCALLSAPRVGSPRLRASLAGIQTTSPRRQERSSADPGAWSEAGSGLQALPLRSDRSTRLTGL